jgi:colanic acid/amylovoran biosynthesis glycosyltransferase
MTPGPAPADTAPPLRVAYIMSRFPKLTETFILREIVAMEREGVRIDLYPLLRERQALVQPAAAPYVRGAHYLPFLSADILRSQAWYLRDRGRRRRYVRALLDVIAGTWRSPNFLVGGLGIFPKVAHAARAMAADRVDHVHCHFANHPALAGFIVHRLVDIPYSFTAHGSDLHVDRTMLASKVREAAFAVTISEDNRRVIAEACGPALADRVAVIHCGVEPAVYAPGPDPRDEGPGAALRIIAIGTLHEVKGQTHLIEACRLLRERGVLASCGIVGDGPDRPALTRQIAEAGLEGSVTLMGLLTESAVIDALHAADVLVAPSVPTRRGKREGIPVVLMEGMAAGLPVVASRLSGIPELVEDGVSGILVPPADPASLATALAELAADPDRRRRMGAAGQAAVVRDFDVRANAERLIGLIQASHDSLAAHRPVARLEEASATGMPERHLEAAS